MKLKYIMVETSGMDTPIIFPPWIEHDVMSLKICLPLISAGFVEFKDNSVQVYGKSVSLGLAAGKNDAKIINSYLKCEV